MAEARDARADALDQATGGVRSGRVIRDSTLRGNMLDKPLLLGTFVLCGLMAGAVAAEPVAASRGQWAGPIGERSGGWPPGDGRIQLRLDGSDKRFSLTLAGPGGALFAGEFETGVRKDVYGPPAARGVMSFLGRGSAVNPIEGKPLAWARRTGEEIVAYRLDLRDGAHRLDRLVLTPAGNRLDIELERREHDKPVERFRATLARGAP